MNHPGQYILMKKAAELPDFRSVPLGGGWIFSCHASVHTFYDQPRDILLIGWAWQTEAERKTPEEEIRALPLQPDGFPAREDVLRMEETWCGRYVLISRGQVMLDASGLLSVFIAPCGIGSDLSLLARESGLEEKVYQPGELLNWMPGPLTPYPQIRRQMPSQIYDLNTGEVLPRRLLMERVPRLDGEQEQLKFFCDVFSVSLRNMREYLKDRKMLVALTGGHDSRCLLALARYAGIEFEAFTLQHPDMSRDDLELPGRLCEAIGVKHTFIPRDGNRYSAEREAEYDRQIGGMVRGKDGAYYAYGQYQEMIDRSGKCAFLRSSVWEFVRENYRRFIGPVFNRQDVYDHYELKPGTLEYDALKAYFDWCDRSPQPGLTDCNRFSWEQTGGCWLNTAEKGFDLYDGAVSLHPMNSRYLLTLLNDFPEGDREIKLNQRKIIRYACPALAEIPYDNGKKEGDNAVTAVREQWRKAVRRLRTMGLRKTVAAYARILRDVKESGGNYR